MPKITLTMDIDDEQAQSLVDRFLETSQAVVDDGDETVPAQETPSMPLDGTLVDDRGVPWHSEYHAATKTKTAKGAWKKRKGGDAAEIDAYEWQYLQKGEPAPPAEAPAMPAAEAPAMPAAAPPAALPGALPTMPAPAPTVVTYDDLMAVFGETNNRLGADYVANAVTGTIYKELGISDPEKLATDETLRAALVEKLRALQ